MVKLADAVGAIHAQGFLHRDLKPANILVDPDGTPIVADFGAAMSMRELTVLISDSFLTDGYGAPEQYLSDKPEGPWTDVYGLGAIAYRALTGKMPPSANARISGEAALPMFDVQSDCPEALRHAVLAALSVEPADRLQSAVAWRDALTASSILPPNYRESYRFRRNGDRRISTDGARETLARGRCHSKRGFARATNFAASWRVASSQGIVVGFAHSDDWHWTCRYRLVRVAFVSTAH